MRLGSCYNQSMYGDVSDDEIRSLMEASQTPEQLAVRRRVVDRLFEDSAAMAAKAIVELAQNSPHDKIRLDAAKYIVERTIGKIADKPVDTTPHWEQEFARHAVYREPSKYELEGTIVADNDSTD